MKPEPDMVRIVTPYITRNGKRIYPKHAKVFAFWVKRKKK